MAKRKVSADNIAKSLGRYVGVSKNKSTRIAPDPLQEDEDEGEMTMRALVILVAICFSANAFAKDKLPKVGNKPLVQVKPKEPMGCKLVGTVKGTKLWAGDCVASELRGATPATESSPEQASPDQKQ